MTRRARCNSSSLWCSSTTQTELAAFDNLRVQLQKTGVCLTQVDPYGQPGSNANMSDVIHDLLLNLSLTFTRPEVATRLVRTAAFFVIAQFWISRRIRGLV